MRSKYLKLSIMVLVLMLISVTGSAQNDSRPVTIMTWDDSGLHFYSVNAEGDLTLLASLADIKVSDELISGEWTIIDPRYVTVSSDQSKIAFVAQKDDEAMLYIYDFVAATIQKTPLPVSFVPEWSPNADYL
jgi:Tol biopolymer transport system component